MPEIIPRQSFLRKKDSLPDCRDNFEQKASTIKDVTKFQSHSMFFVKKGQANMLDGVFDANPPMP